MPERAQGGEAACSRTEALQQTLQEGLDALIAEMGSGVSPRLTHYLEFMAQFHEYSAGNQILIYMQRPNATHVAGYKAWEKLGYHVAKGERGIQILAPMTRRIRVVDDLTGEELVLAAPTGGFRVVHVFDAAQLSPRDRAARSLPAFYTPLGHDHAVLAARLEEAIRMDGIAVGEEPHLRRSVQGVSHGGSIGLKPGLDGTNKALVLIHEWGHEILHQRAYAAAPKPRGIKECEAEATAYLVAHHFGLYNPFTSDYLQNWGNTPSTLYSQLKDIQQASAYIITRIERPVPSDQ